MKRLLFVILPFLLLGLQACSRQPSYQTGDRYEVRAVLVRFVPDPQTPKSLDLLHEAVPDFKDDQGRVSRMDPMMMPFAPAPGLDLTGLAPGDKVRVRFTVDWNRMPRMILTAVEKLDPATELSLGGFSLE